MKNGFSEIDFSGDVGIEAWGHTEEEVLAQAAYGLFSLMVSGDVNPATSRRFTVQSDSAENLLVDWLNELISTASLNGEVYRAVEVRLTGPFGIRAEVSGEAIDEKHRLRFDVKAATYHRMVFRETDEGFYIRVIFDL
jgi:SHS2 domain-containing protein